MERMKQFSIIDAAKAWFDLTHVVLDLKKIPAPQLQNILKDTYEILYFYHRQDCAPKMVSKLLLEESLSNQFQVLCYLMLTRKKMRFLWK